MIYRLFYVSRCTIRNDLDAKNIVEHISSDASSKNQAKDITGAMTFDGNDFAQILEGDKTKVQELFEIIKADKRHKNVVILKEQHDVKRHYAEWGMKKLDSSNYNELVSVMAT